MKKNWDNIVVGILIGLLIPLLGLIFLSFFKSEGESFFDFVGNIIDRGKFTNFLSFGLIFNFIVFYLFLKKNLNRIAGGIVMATLVMAIVAVYFKVFN